jgi:hypothetical protein
VANLKKNQFHCPACKNTTGIVQVSLVLLHLVFCIKVLGVGSVVQRSATSLTCRSEVCWLE